VDGRSLFRDPEGDSLTGSSGLPRRTDRTTDGQPASSDSKLMRRAVPRRNDRRPWFVPALLFLWCPTLVVAQEPDAAAGEEPVCRVVGRVLDALTGDAVPNASVWLEGADDAAFVTGTGTALTGGFVLETPICDSAVIRVRMLGYVETTVPVTFDSDGQTQRVTIRLELDPVTVETLTVEIARSARLRDVGFYARKEWEASTGKDLGQFYDPDEVEGRSAIGSSALALALRSRIRWVYGGCSPSFYINGVWYRSQRRAESMLSYGLNVREVEGMEIYRAVHGAVPEEFRDPNSNTCGAVVVWTKGGARGEAPQIEVELCEPSDDLNGISFGGLVSDRLTGVPLPAAYVALTTSATDGAVADTWTVADENGVYRYCDLDAWPVTLQAQFGSNVAEAFEVDSSRAGPGYWEVDLRVAVADGGTLVGMVVGEGIDPTRTEVVLEGTERTAHPDETGYFEIDDLMPDGYVVVLKRGDEVLMRRRVSIYEGLRETMTLDLGVPRS
jgi:hypothetical protein